MFLRCAFPGTEIANEPLDQKRIEGRVLNIYDDTLRFLYNMLLRIGLVTDAGSGIPRVIRLTREAIGQDPAFRIEGSEFVVALPRPGNRAQKE